MAWGTGCVHKKLVSGEVVSKTRVAAGHFQMELLCPHIAQNATPGQFIQVRVNRSYDPLLCRPLAVYRTREDIFEILFKVVGKGTHLLAEKRIGDTLDVIGPLGTGFPMDDDFQLAVLVAGGMGIASLMALAETIVGNPPKSPFTKGGLDEGRFSKGGVDEGRFSKEGVDEGRFSKGGLNGRQITALIGASTQDKIVGEKELLALGAEVRIATEDGSTGHRGMVSELLEETLLRVENSSQIYADFPSLRSRVNSTQMSADKARTKNQRKSALKSAYPKDQRAIRIFACGPIPMLKAVAQIAAQHEIPAYVSLEERMACGVGACLGCACEVVSPEGAGTACRAPTYRMVCVDGPVFDAQEIVWR